ncbi:MAG: T9SS type A sorting domain-containing protein [Bacteroidia bacterium]
MKKLLLNLILLLLGVATSFSQQQEFSFQQWAGSSGTQNFFYKNITKSDASGNIYTAGATLNGNGNYDLLLVKYNKSGVVQWTKQYDGAGGGHDMATGIHIDGSGNVYVTGTTYVNGTNYNDIITIKYNSSGTQQWLSTYNGSGSSYDAGGAIVVNTAGTSVFICGGAMTTSNLSDFITISYNASTGAQNWANTYNYNGNYDVAAKISLTGLNQVTLVVSGGVQHNSTTWKYATVNYASSTGFSLGQPQISGNNTGSLDELGDICEDASQTYTYVAGSVDNSGTGTGYDYKIAKLQNSNLSVVWERTWNGADSLADKAADIVVDASGNVYVTGFTTTDTQGKNYATVKYNSSGTLQWTKYHNGAGNGIDEATAINIDASNNVYVTGTSHTGGSQDYYTIKYKPDNTVVWEQAYNGLYNGLDKAYDIAVNPSTNEIVVSGQTQTATGYSYTTVSIGQATTVTNPNEVFNSTFTFTENLGQLLKSNGTSASNIKYYNFSSSPTTYFSDTAVSYVLSSIDTLSATNDTLHRVDRTYTGHKTPGQYGINKRSDYYNFYLAHIPEGRAHVTNYNRLITPELYSKIDVLYTGNSKGLVTTFVCKPGSSPAATIKMKFSGADSIRVVNNDLIIYTKLGQIKHPRASAYELDNNGTAYILGWFPTYVRSGNEITFTLGSYNTSRNLIIDIGFPSVTAGGSGSDNLEWCTYYGASKTDRPYASATDSINSYYLGGYTSSEFFPTTNGAFQTVLRALDDGFLVKFKNGTQRIWATFYGGEDSDRINDIEIDRKNKVLGIAAVTYSDSLPTFDGGSLAYDQADLGGDQDGYVGKFDMSNGTPLWISYFGGNIEDDILSVSFDTDGNMFAGGFITQADTLILGNGTSCGVPTNRGIQMCNPGGSTYYQNGYGGVQEDGLLLKFDTNNKLVWSTFFGGSNQDIIFDIAVNKITNDLYALGSTRTATTPNNNCAVPTNGGFPLCNGGGGSYNQGTNAGMSDAFIARFSNSGQIKWSTYFGGNKEDQGDQIAFNSSGDVYITGISKRATAIANAMCQPVVNGGFPLCGDTSTGVFVQYQADSLYDAFVTRFNSNNQITWSTLYGGKTEEGWSWSVERRMGAIAVDASDNIYITGSTEKKPNHEFPVLNRPEYYYQATNAGNTYKTDAYIVQFGQDNKLKWATNFGGDNSNNTYGYDHGATLATYGSEYLYLAGFTYSSTFPYVCANPSDYYCDTTYSYVFPADNDHSDIFIARFILDDETGIYEEGNNSSGNILIYPNPSRGLFNWSVNSLNSINTEIKVFDTMGKLIFIQNQKSTNQIKAGVIDLSNEAKGIYVVQISVDGTLFHQKIILQ